MFVEANAALHVEKMVVKALVPRESLGARALRRVAKEAQGLEHPIARLGARYVAAFHADRIRGERETDCRQAREYARRIAVGHQSILRIGVGPEVIESPVFDVFEKIAGLIRCIGLEQPRRRRRLQGVTAF